MNESRRTGEVFHDFAMMMSRRQVSRKLRIHVFLVAEREQAETARMAQTFQNYSLMMHCDDLLLL